jgi:hypothetical protein
VKKAGFYPSAPLKPSQRKRNPPPPFTTSTLQQEAARKLGFNASRTMQTAQRLYEAGHITYMRTDGVSMDEGAINELRTAIGGQFGNNYVPANRVATCPRPRTPGSARSYPPDRSAARPQTMQPRWRPSAALRTDLEARRRVADGSSVDRAHQRRFTSSRPAKSSCAPPAKSFSSTAS